MDVQRPQTHIVDPVVRKRKGPRYLAVALLLVAMAVWSVILPVLGVLYVVQLLS